MVGDDDVGLRHRLAPAHGDQPRVARAAADQDDAAAAPAAPAGGAVGDAAVGQPGDDGVAHADRPAADRRRRARRHQVALPPDGRVQTLEARRSSARAQKIRGPSASAADRGVHRGSSVAATAYQAPSRSPGP